MENRNLHILGASAAVPTKDRWHTAQLLEIGRYRFLVDCGEGAQYQLIRYGLKFNKINAIFISHLHGDHFLGIFGLINSMSLGGRTRPLSIYCPAGLQSLVTHHGQITGSVPEYEITWVELENEPIQLIDEDDLEVWAHPVDHRITCHAFKFIHGNKLRKLDIEKCGELQVPVEWYRRLKEGEDYINNGNRIANDVITTDPKMPISYTYITDSLYSDKFVAFAQDSDWLYHESTFLHEDHERAHQTFHSTAQEAGVFAAKSQVKHLILGHFSSRYLYLEDHKREAEQFFPKVEIALEGKKFSL